MPIEPLFHAIADELAAAESDRVPVQPISDRYPEFDVAAAYAVQQVNLDRRLGRGAVLIGRKVGLTNQAMQAQLRVNEPDFGFLLDEMRLEPGAELSRAELIQPRIEPEIAFFLQRDVVGPHVQRADVLAATEAVAPALEIIDSRIVDWRITLVDTIADNASSSRVVLGQPTNADGLSLITLSGWIERDGEVVGSGRGADVLGDPATAVAWVVNKLSEFGERLHAGDVVIPGALCASVPLTPGSVFTSTLDGLGSVSIRVVS